MTEVQQNTIDPMALLTFTKLLRCSETVTSDSHQDLAEYKLTTSQFGILEAIYHGGAMCQREIAQKILKSNGNITTVIDNLEKRDLVLRERSQEDRRYITVHLTQSGRALISEVFPRVAESIAGRMRVLSERELKDLGRLCKKSGLA